MKVCQFLFCAVWLAGCATSTPATNCGSLSPSECEAMQDAVTEVAADSVVVSSSQPPVLIGGMDALYANMTYPPEALKAGVQGRVLLLLTIDESGDLTEVDIVEGIGSGCEEAAIRAVKKTGFKPAKEQGKPVKAQIMLPILFRIR